MLRAAYLPRTQPAALNLLLVTKRWQQSGAASGSGTNASTKSTPGSNTTQFASSNPSSANKTQTASTTSSSNAPIDRTNNPQKTTTTPPPTTPPPRKATPPPSSGATGKSGGGGSAVKAIAYGVALGLGATLIYAEYENGSFRRKVESNLPLSSTVLGGLDKVIDPVFGRHKTLTAQISEKLPDLSYIKDKLPDKDQIKKAGEQAKDAVNSAYEKLPEYKKVKGAVHDASEQVKGAVNTVRDALPDAKTVKKNLSSAKDQVEDAAKSVRDTVKDALPATKGFSGESARKMTDPVFLEEAGEPIVPPPITKDKYKKLEAELDQLFEPLSKQIDDALSATREHVKHVKTLIDNPNAPNEEVKSWTQADQLQKQATSAYDKVTESLRTWKDKLTEYTTTTSGQTHPNEKQLDEKYKQLQSDYTTSTFVQNFRSYIDEATKSFQKEIETMFPSLAGKSPTQLNQEDLQALLAHAHRRVAKLQNDIARMRVNESDSVKTAIGVARADVDRLVDEQVAKRVKVTTDQLTDELKQYEKNLRSQFDEQLKREIVLQHQALSQYLSDVLSRQYQEWTREFEKQVEHESLQIRLSIQRELQDTLDRVHAMEHAIDANRDSVQRGRQAQKLWIQAQNILNQIVHGSNEENLKMDIEAVSKLVPDEKFVQILIDELKQEDPITTNEEILRERFVRVKILCRRVALIDNEHNSLSAYFLSYLQSLFIVRQRDNSILIDDAIDLNRLDTFTLLNYVQSYLEHDQWYNALRLMQLLTGEARNAAQSWIHDTRAYLAKKQTSELLDAYSNSIGLGTLPRVAQN